MPPLNGRSALAPSAKITALFTLTLLVLLVNALLSHRNTNNLIASKNTVAHSWEVKNGLQNLYSLLSDAERSQRNFLLTEDGHYLVPYRQAVEDIDTQLAVLSRLTVDNPLHHKRLADLDLRVRHRLATLQQQIERRQRNTGPFAPEPLEWGRAQMDAVRVGIRNMTRIEDNLLQDRLVQAQRSEASTRETFFFATFIAVLAVIVAGALLRRILIERQRSEQNMERLVLDLERRVAERTESLSHVNVRLEEANRELEAFSYSVSHDLRAPLRHIGGFVELMQKKEAQRLSEAGVRYLSIISEAVRHAGTLVDDLLAFSRMSRTTMRQIPVSMDALVAEVRRALVNETEGREIEWKIGPLPPVVGDPTLLRLVWQNLIGNAVKYTSLRSRTEIEIGANETDEEFRYFVKDNGVGFDMQYADKLFGVFQRLHSKDQFEGTGIGLANVRRIVTRHEGRSGAEGEVERGATFWFTLPRSLPSEGGGNGSGAHSAGGG